MLTKTENRIMSAISDLCREKPSVLISPSDLIKIADAKGLTQDKLDCTLGDLASDGYFDLVFSDRRGEKVYCIILTEKGRGYTRSVKQMKRNLLFKIGLSAALAVFSFLIGLILKCVF